MEYNLASIHHRFLPNYPITSREVAGRKGCCVMADAGRYDDLSPEREEALQQFMAYAFKIAASVPGGYQFFIDPPGYTIEQRARELKIALKNSVWEEPISFSANSHKAATKATKSVAKTPAEQDAAQLNLW
jgi:hypothetical protein